MGWREGNMFGGVMRVVERSGGVLGPTHVRTCFTRESGDPGKAVGMRDHVRTAGGKAHRRNPSARATGESDGNIVPEKSANKGAQPPAESMEGREPTKGNPNQQAMDRIQDRETVSDKLTRVRQRAEADKSFVFVNLFHLLKVPLLREAFYALKRDASPGLDGVNWYEELRARMHEPVSRTGAWLRSVMTGATRYYGVPGNMKSLRAMYNAIGRMWRRSLCRRSQKAKLRWTWERFYRLLFHWLPRPRVCHPYTSQRFDAIHPR